MNVVRFYTKEFANALDAQDWLNSFSEEPEIVGYAAFGCGDPQNFNSGLYITVKAPIQDHE